MAVAKRKIKQHAPADPNFTPSKLAMKSPDIPMTGVTELIVYDDKSFPEPGIILADWQPERVYADDEMIEIRTVQDLVKRGARLMGHMNLRWSYGYNAENVYVTCNGCALDVDIPLNEFGNSKAKIAKSNALTRFRCLEGNG